MMTKEDLAKFDRDTLEERFIELLVEYKFLSMKMTEINNIVQPLWSYLRERRNDMQTIEQYILREKEEK